MQRAALVYLSRANRFSRSPFQVADYLLADEAGRICHEHAWGDAA